MPHRLALVLALALPFGCGAPSQDLAPVRRATHEDLPAASFERTAVVSSGADQALDVVLIFLQGILDEDERLLMRMLAERLPRALPRRDDGPTQPVVERSVYVRQLLASVRAARLLPGTRAAALLESESLEVIPVPLDSERWPNAVVAGDLVVRFRVAPAGRRALAGVAPGGAAQLVVRPGSEPRIIAH